MNPFSHGSENLSANCLPYDMHCWVIRLSVSSGGKRNIIFALRSNEVLNLDFKIHFEFTNSSKQHFKIDLRQ